MRPAQAAAALRRALMAGLVGVAGVGIVSSAGADQFDLVVATVDPGSPLSPLVAGRAHCADASTLTGSGRITVAGATVAQVRFAGRQCTSAWDPIGFRVSSAARDAVRRQASRTHRTPVLVASVTARSVAGTQQTTSLRATLRPVPDTAPKRGLVVATVDAGSRLSVLVPGRARCTGTSTLTGSGRITVAGATVARVQFTGGPCTSAWDPIGFRVSAAARNAVRREASKTRRTPVLIASVTARPRGGMQQTTAIRATLRQ